MERSSVLKEDKSTQRRANMAEEEHACVPEADPELFGELEAVFERYLGQSDKYIFLALIMRPKS